MFDLVIFPHRFSIAGTDVAVFVVVWAVSVAEALSLPDDRVIVPDGGDHPTLPVVWAVVLKARVTLPLGHRGQVGRARLAGRLLKVALQNLPNFTIM